MVNVETASLRKADPARSLLVIGGSVDHLGGVEAFCERSTHALAMSGGWQTRRIAAGTAYLTLGRLPAFLRGIATLLRYRGSRRPDIVWLQYVNLPDLAYLIVAKMLGMRVMVTPHLGANWRSQTSKPLRLLSERALRRADRLALISWTQQDEIILPTGVPRSLIRNFLPVEVLTGALPDAEQLPPSLQIIHSSRLSEGKGTFLVVDVCKRLHEAGVPFDARITGGADSQTMARLREMIADHGLQDRIAVLGRVPEEELLHHLRHSDILVHLSRIDSYPLIVLEAMACSAVPVVMELAGARDMVETYVGHVVGTTSAVEETTAWIRGCNLQALRLQRRDVAHRVRTDYNWQRCVTALEAALDVCLSGDATTVTRPEPVV